VSRLRTTLVEDVLAKLPEACKLDDASAPRHVDLFLCALGFEPRCLSVPKELGRLAVKVSHGCYLEPSTNRSDNRANLPALTGYLEGFCTSLGSLQSDDLEFPERLRQLVISAGKGRSGPAVVALDISVLANRALMRVLKVLLESDVDLTVAYAEAEVYHPTREEYRDHPEVWRSENALGLERGVADVGPSREYPGQHLDPLPDFLILFPSFRADRTRAIIARVDLSLRTVPAGKVVWLIGVPHLRDNRWRADAMRELNGISATAPQYDVSTFEYKEVLQRLHAIHGEHEQEFNITVSPLGSKLQALATALFCYMHPDVRVMFAIPKEYNAARYSQGCAAMWLFGFGNTASLRQSLESVGSLWIEE